MTNRVFEAFEDFLLDDSFKQYVERSDDQSVSYWNEWISAHPSHKEEFRKAVEVSVTLINNRKNAVNIDKKESLRSLLSEIEKTGNIRSWTTNIPKLLLRIAAVIVLSAGLAWIWDALRIESPELIEHVVYNEIIVPTGEKSQIILSDGSHVWINSDSRLKYPVAFGNESRDVILEGEAYFEVTENKKSVFTVITKDAEIKVLGTAFNVKSYPEDQKTQTTVVSGLVKIESRKQNIEPILIKPNQMAVIREISDTMAAKVNEISPELTVLDNVNTEVLTSWKDHLLVFADETFEDIIVKMERWYNVEISVLDDGLKQERYTGKFVHNETVYEVLEAIKATTPIVYSAKE
ncbi:MAG: FecR family protein, partial [Bacteroidales bacterium]|nr:FecR family protein [Bacteroidales bacterium]